TKMLSRTILKKMQLFLKCGASIMGVPGDMEKIRLSHARLPEPHKKSKYRGNTANPVPGSTAQR
ncbi:MAG: hypothetical protein ABFR82_17840, partial [Nitrospirota bacterium]